MTENDFQALAAAGFNRIPLTLETLADLDTPLSLYLKLANAPGSYLLESVIGGERFGRYSIIGLAARERIEVAAGRARVIRDGAVVEAGELLDGEHRPDERPPVAVFQRVRVVRAVRARRGQGGEGR